MKLYDCEAGSLMDGYLLKLQLNISHRNHRWDEFWDRTSHVKSSSRERYYVMSSIIWSEISPSISDEMSPAQPQFDQFDQFSYSMTPKWP
jgi:hypothetical protein